MLELILLILEAVVWKCSVKNSILKTFAKFTSAEISFLILLQSFSFQVYWKKTPAQIFSCKYWKVSPVIQTLNQSKASRTLLIDRETSEIFWPKTTERIQCSLIRRIALKSKHLITGEKLRKTFRRCYGCLLNVL